MTFVMANCGGHNHFQHGLIRNSQEREITGTVQDMLEAREVVKDVTTKFSVCHQRVGAVFTVSKSGMVLATLRIPAVGEATDLADDCGDLPGSSSTETCS